MRTWLARSGLMMLAASACLAAGCASERDPINRVQPNALPKTFFLGADLKSPNDDPEFRMKSFTVGSSVSQSAYSIGEFSAVDRIRWEITEGMVLARRSYQESPGADNRGTTAADIANSTDKNASAAATGTIVAAFKIEKHFDIRRDYNAHDRRREQRRRRERQRSPVERARVRARRLVAEPRHVDRRRHALRERRDGHARRLQRDRSHRRGRAASRDRERLLRRDEQVHGRPRGRELLLGRDQEVPARELLHGLVDVTTATRKRPRSAPASRRSSPTRTSRSSRTTTQWKDVVGNTGGQGDGANPWLGSARTTWDPQYGFKDCGDASLQVDPQHLEEEPPGRDVRRQRRRRQERHRRRVRERAPPATPGTPARSATSPSIAARSRCAIASSAPSPTS